MIQFESVCILHLASYFCDSWLILWHESFYAIFFSSKASRHFDCWGLEGIPLYGVRPEGKMNGIQKTQLRIWWYDRGSCRNSNLRNCKLTRKQFQGFNGTQTQGVSVSASECSTIWAMKTHTLRPLQWEHWPSVVLLFATKLICTCYRPKANSFCSKWLDSSVWRDFCAILSNRELKQLRRRRRQLQKTIGLMIKTTALHVHHAF